MKLRNKKTGEIGYLYEHSLMQDIIIVYDVKGIVGKYTSLAELNGEWEDYKSDKERWYINENGGVLKYIPVDPNGEDLTYMGYQKEIGNYFETKEGAEKAVEKLKAWKRLKDKGFRFTLTPGVGSLDITPGKFQIEITAEMPEKWFCCDAVQKDLEVCFGGEG